MTRKKKKAVTSENFYFTVDDWCRHYLHEINRAKSKYFRQHIYESNIIRIIGRLRNTTKRKIETGELYLSCMDGIRDKLSDEAKAVGTAWVRNRHLQCSVLMPLIPFHSIPVALTAGEINEFYVTVMNLRYSKGETDSFSIRQGLSNLDNDGEKPAELADELACFESIDS